MIVVKEEREKTLKLILGKKVIFSLENTSNNSNYLSGTKWCFFAVDFNNIFASDFFAITD